MILLITRHNDPHTDLVVDRLHELRSEFIRFNTDDADKYEIGVYLGKGSIKTPAVERAIALSEITSIWYRRESVPNVIENTPIEFRESLRSEWRLFLRNLWVSLEERFWINSISAIEKANNKLQQLLLAKAVGFNVPDGMLSNSAPHVKKLLAQHRKGLYKPFSGFTIGADEKTVYANILDAKMFEKEVVPRSVAICPGIFQQYIKKKYELRITVVGNTVFATKIDSQASEKTRVDWRRYDFENVAHSIVELPVQVSAWCIEVVRRLGLVFAAIDVIVTPDEKYYFLELNPMGQWAWIEHMTGQSISREIAQLLSKEKVQKRR